jgi:hypothetical protein
MASRENQGLQATLIVFVLITIFLAGATYWNFSTAQSESNRADAKQAEAQKAQAAMNDALKDNQRLKEMLGFDIAAPMADVEKRFTQDMATFGADYPETDPKNYYTLPKYLMQAAVGRSKEASDAKTREEQALAEKAAAEQRHAGQIAALETANTQLVTTYNQERDAFSQERARINTSNAKLAGDLRTRDQLLNTERTSKKEMQDKFQAQIAEYEQTLDAFRTKQRESQQPNFETAAGSIIFVNQADRSVWIDLGIADGLQRHTTFSVYDREVHEYSPEHAKGQLEVTKLIDRHLAEARIIGDDIRNPIIQGDLIYSPAWRPGVFMHFAVAGFIDINGDGLEDKELLRNIIAANGGVIDAEVDADGNMVGQPDVNTRYLILGERPDEKTADQKGTGYQQLYDRASQLGIELMPLPRFLGLMGYKPGSKTVQIGSRGGPAARAPQPGAAPTEPGAPAQPGAPAAPDAGAAPGAADEAPAGEDPNDPFRTRRPPRGEAGAF